MEQYRVDFARQADIDLRKSAQYIATRMAGPITASKWIKIVRITIDKKLSYSPQKYRLVDNPVFASKGFRSLIVKKRKVFFVIQEQEKIVKVARIIYAKRDWARILSGDSGA
ncbi:MAG: type II toxin-antitoxin system RelE/ParE family toxin [Chitinispirillia bacterium]|nr:type II toxin-antitoxin system RelE/ParE family toxin [Chitinispirillia bacterium]MCL2241111.1 type II toxin-antitoxin system RelE/ParE family toxin [Chitinispirillia bacterium]